MAKCQKCKADEAELHPFELGSKTKMLCEECLELAEEEAAIAEMSESAMQDMMGYKGSW